MPSDRPVHFLRTDDEWPELRFLAFGQADPLRSTPRMQLQVCGRSIWQMHQISAPLVHVLETRILRERSAGESTGTAVEVLDEHPLFHISIHNDEWPAFREAIDPSQRRRHRFNLWIDPDHVCLLIPYLMGKPVIVPMCRPGIVLNLNVIVPWQSPPGKRTETQEQVLPRTRHSDNAAITSRLRMISSPGSSSSSRTAPILKLKARPGAVSPKKRRRRPTDRAGRTETMPFESSNAGVDPARPG